MTENQTFVAAADMLVNVRQGNTPPIEDFPSDDLINKLKFDIANNCSVSSVGTDDIVDITTAIILLDDHQTYIK